MNYLLSAKMRYYNNDSSETILSKVCDSISRNLSGCKHELPSMLPSSWATHADQ